MFAQFRVRPHARLFQLDDLVVDLFERLLQRFDQLVDRGLPAFEVASCRFLKLFEVLPREIEKRLVVVAQRIGRQRFERVRQFLFRAREQLRQRGVLAAMRLASSSVSTLAISASTFVSRP